MAPEEVADVLAIAALPSRISVIGLAKRALVYRLPEIIVFCPKNLHALNAALIFFAVSLDYWLGLDQLRTITTRNGAVQGQSLTRRPPGPISSQMMKPISGSRMISRIQSSFSTLDAPLCRMLMSAQMSRMRTII